MIFVVFFICGMIQIRRGMETAAVITLGGDGEGGLFANNVAPSKLSSTTSHHQQHRGHYQEEEEDQNRRRPLSSSMQQPQQHHHHHPHPPEQHYQQQERRQQQDDDRSSTKKETTQAAVAAVAVDDERAAGQIAGGSGANVVVVVDPATTTLKEAKGTIRTTSDNDVAVTSSSSSTTSSAGSSATANNNGTPDVVDDERNDVDTDAHTVVELPKYTNITLKLPTPVLVASLPKSGTVSVWRYFLCGGQKASHLYAKLNGTVDFTPATAGGSGSGAGKRPSPKKNQNQKQMISGQCMRRNYISQRPLLHNCGNYDIWSDTGYIKIPPTPHHCYYPNIHGLHAWYESYPHSTIILLKRNPITWSHSIQNWGNGGLLKRWKICQLPGFIIENNDTNDGNTNTTQPLVVPYNSIENLIRFYEWHVHFIRNFTRNHPTLTYIETSLEDSNIGNILQTATNIPASCWAKCNPTTDTSSCVRANNDNNGTA